MSTTSSRKERGRSSSPFGVVATAHYESGPPASKMKLSEDDGDVMEVVKEEEWEERRKKTTTKTRNIERRVQRQLVLEDGHVIDDTGPVVSEDATEDTVVKEVVSDQNSKPEGQLALEPPPGEGWIATPGAIVISEKSTKTTKSHDEKEEEIETEEIQRCGDVTNEEAEDHIKGQNDLRELINYRQSHGLAVAIPKKRIVHEACRKKGNIDTTDVHESSKIQDGHVVTETERTVRQEQYDNESLPDSGSSLSDGSVHEATKETSHNIVHTKDEDLLEYYAVPKGGTLAQGVKIGEGMHVVSEDVQEDRQGNDEDAKVDNLKKTRRPSRRDALTKKLLNHDQEERTRKCETDKWLEHHFGSESGRSEDSLQDIEDSSDKKQKSGGNRITITMSPYPAAQENSLSSPSSSLRPNHRNGHAPATSTPKAPPPPPPKPERFWSSTAEPPRSPKSPTTQRLSLQSPDIQDSELAVARSRLRSTGLKLTDEDKENNEPHNFSSKYLNRHEIKESSQSYQYPSPTKDYSSKNEPIYSSRFRSGKNINYSPSFGTDNYGSHISVSPPPSITNVGRSQSFHIQTLPYSSKKDTSNTWLKSSRKDYRSEERLDDIDAPLNSRYQPSPLHSSKINDRNSSIEKYYHNEEKSSRRAKSTWSPPREPTPPPPPSNYNRRNHLTKEYSFSSNSGREAGTQTGPSPVPPPRTKRKKRPTSSYFFGQENGDASSSSVHSLNNRSHNRHSYYETAHSENNYYNDDKNRYYDYSTMPSRHSSKIGEVDRRYKTTKTITPVLAVPYNGKSDDRHNKYSSYSTNKSSWTNTVDPRRRPRNNSEEERPITLPRKTSNKHHVSFPKKTYVFGESEPSSLKSHDDAYTYNDRSKVHHVPITRSESHSNHYHSSLSNGGYKSNKPVGRSQSFNVQAGRKYPSSSGIGRPLSEISDQRTTSAYSSSPYVNLRSPNLIATIARTSSTRIPDYDQADEYNGQHETKSEEKRDRFMKGLLDTAPELYHFIHGNENEDTTDGRTIGNNRHSSPPPNFNKLNGENSRYSPPGSSMSPTYSARIFTFGKGDTNTLTRTSQGMEEEQKNLYNSNYLQNKSPITSDYNKIHTNLDSPNRKSTFNLKTSGSSLLYSPSFRSHKEDSLERRSKKKSSHKKERMSGDFTRSSGLNDDGPVSIQVRDWNMR